MITLSAGLIGLGLVLVIVMDQVLVDYDAPAEFMAWLKDVLAHKRLNLHYRTEDMLMELEKAKNTAGGLRLIDQRREQLRDIAAVESRLQRPNQPQGPIVLTPLPPPVLPAAE
jgi:hypothetical protein